MSRKGGATVQLTKPALCMMVPTAVYLQERYVRAVTPHMRPGGRVVMLAFSDANPEPWTGPRRISREHATRIWGAAGWRIDSIEDTKFQTLNTTHAGLAIVMQATRVA